MNSAQIIGVLFLERIQYMQARFTDDIPYAIDGNEPYDSSCDGSNDSSQLLTNNGRTVVGALAFPSGPARRWWSRKDDEYAYAPAVPQEMRISNCRTTFNCSQVGDQP